MFFNTHIFRVPVLSLVFFGAIIFPASVFAVAPMVSTEEPEHRGSTGATLVGYVRPMAADTERWFEWGTSPTVPLSYATTKTFHGPDNDYFYENLQGLSPGTVYFFRAVARNGSGTKYGKVVSFRTKSGGSKLPIVTTQSVSSVSSNQASVSCSLDPQGNFDTQRWVEWGRVSTASQNSTSKEYQGSGGSYSALLSGLSQNTAYYYRCVAKSNTSVAVYGNIQSFHTGSVSVPQPIPTPAPTYISPYGNTGGQTSLIVSTKLASEIFNTSARLNAVVLPGNASNVYGWFEWGGTPDLGHASARRYLGSGSYVLLSDMISGLTPGTTYFFKPVMESTQGRVEGALLSFRTTGTSPFPALVTPPSTNYPSGTKPTPTASYKPGAVAVSKEKRALTVEIVPGMDTVAKGERFHEVIEVENTTNTAMAGVIVRVILPNEATYISAGSDGFSENGKTLMYEIGELKPKGKAHLIFWLEVGAEVADKTPIETIVVVTWGDNLHLNDTQSVGRVTVTVDANKTVSGGGSALTAAAVQGIERDDTPASSGFFSSLKDWGIIIGAVFMLFAAYLLFVALRRKDGDENEKETDMFQEEYSDDPFVSGKRSAENTTATAVIPVVPVKKVTTAQWASRGAPPENLPV